MSRTEPFFWYLPHTTAKMRTLPVFFCLDLVLLLFSCFIEVMGLTAVASEYARERKDHMQKHSTHTSPTPTMPSLPHSELPSFSRSPPTHSHKHTPHTLTCTHTRTQPLPVSVSCIRLLWHHHWWVSGREPAVCTGVLFALNL